MPARARSRGHRLAAYRQCSADPVRGCSGEGGGAGVKRAELLRRLAALAVDVPFVVALLAVEAVVAGIGLSVASLVLPMPAAVAEALPVTVGVVLGFVGPLPYFAGLESSALGATIGKLVFRVRIVGEDGRRVSGRRASTRFMLKWVGLLPSGAGWLVALVRPDHLAFHDSVSGTRAINGEAARPPNKAMKQTKLSAAPLLGRQGSHLRRCRLMPAPAGSDAGTASQLIASVGPTQRMRYAIPGAAV